MNLNDYQRATSETAVYPIEFPASGLYYLTLGLVGEAGEYANTVKKLIRDKGWDGDIANLDIEDRVILELELGDILWYIAQNAQFLGITLESLARTNLAKLNRRKLNNQLHGSGSNR